jgi:hypothetical protein
MYVGRPVGRHSVSGVGRPTVPVFGGLIRHVFHLLSVFLHTIGNDCFRTI